MQYVFSIIIILSLAMIAIEDLRRRNFRIIWLLVSVGSAIAFGLLSEESNFQWTYLALNTAFIAFNIVGLVLYFSVKEKKLINIVNTKLGLGDLLFFVFLILGFSTLNLIVFFFLAVLVSLIFGILALAISKKKQTVASTKIPLAGIFSVGYIIVLAICKLDIAHVYSDAKLKHILETFLM